MHPFLESAWLKYSRGQLHLRTLRGLVEAYSARQISYVRVTIDKNTGYGIYRLDRPLEKPPTELSPVIGDVLFNYRSALDHLMCALVKISGNEPDRDTQFPIFQSQDDFRQKASKMCKGVSSTIQRKLELEQPYNSNNEGSGRYLWLLSQLNNFDKHRGFPLISWSYQGSFTEPKYVKRWREIAEQVTMHTGRIEPGTVIARIPKDYIQYNFVPFFEIAFDQDTAAPEERVLGVLYQSPVITPLFS